jgi:cytochrome c-type biogenesis protein CcmH
MLTFILLAALALVVGVGAVTIPLLVRRDDSAPPPAPLAAGIAALVLVAGSVAIYATKSNWWSHPVAADSPQTMVARLARRLEREPDDLQGWLTLGRSYAVLEQYGLAVRAYQHADRLASGRNAEALVGEAEALLLEDENQLDGRAGRLLEQALVLAPGNGKALFYGGAAALHRGDFKLGRERFAQLLAADPPDNVKSVLRQQIAAIDQRIAAGPSGSAPAAAPDGAPAAASQQGPAVRVTVQLPRGASTPEGTSRLFVLVRDPARPGPPLAAKLLPSRFPQTVQLTPADSPMGRSFAAGQKVQVVARISRSGNPLAARGDPFGEVAYLVGKDGLVNITINQVTP